MNRGYTQAEYRDVIERVVDTVPDVGLGTDVIVGFPGETDAAFAETYRFLEALPFAYFHVFSYSKRYGTKAARLDGHVHSHVIKERSQALRRLSSAKRREFASRYLGKSVDVLFEQQDENGVWTGLTSNYLRVGVVSEHLRNEIASVTIRAVDETTALAMGSLNSSAGRTADPSPTPAWETAGRQRSAPPRPQ
jgi:threonylcarbamoyladenosine tRNA methylthiotransferase MtaB